ncbi:RHS repeat domain-containing protein [Candidatus Poribacteria bacterium]
MRVKNTSGTYDSTYIKHQGQRVAEVDPQGNNKYVHPDHLGSTSLITDAQGSQVETTHYTPYGLALSGGQTSRYSYEGQEYDNTIDQYDFHFRGYKAEWGIFTQPDSLIPNVYSPQSLNRYSFERGNPYKYTDPTGHVEAFTTVVLIIVLNIIVSVTATIIGGADEKRHWDYTQEITQISKANAATPYGEFNRAYASLLSTRGTFKARRYSPSGTEKKYIDSEINPRLQEISDYDDIDSIEGVFDLLESQGLNGDSTYRKIRATFVEGEQQNLYHITPIKATRDMPVLKGHYRSGGGWWRRLGEIAENAGPGETAYDIIHQWRKEVGIEE